MASHSENLTDLLSEIRRQLERADSLAVGQRDARANVALLIALLGPVAVLALAAQVLLVPHGPLALSLIGGEILAIAAAATLELTSGAQAHRAWIRARVCGELLRREETLLKIGAGPYAAVAPADVARHARNRIEQLTATETLATTLARESARLDTWAEARMAPAGGSLVARVRDYRTRRTREQVAWMRNRAVMLHRKNERNERLLRIALALALVLAVTHLTLLALQHEGEPAPAFEKYLTLAALGVPSLGATFAALRSVFGYRRLAGSYDYYGESLAHVDEMLEDLEARANDTPNAPELWASFGRLVVGAESILHGELVHWWLTVEPEEPTPAG
jgi:hypothetical protein